MKYSKFFKSLFLIVILFLSNCISKEKLLEEKMKFDRFTDNFFDNVYTNEIIKFKMTFDQEWSIVAKSEQFNKLQKNYAEYFSSQYGEVLFIGHNDEKKMGIRATCETVNLTNEEYFNAISNSMADYFYKYNLKIEKNEDILLKNIKVKHIVIKARINQNNIFIFDTILFKINRYNVRIDVWLNEKEYENQKNYILSLYNSISIIEN